MGEKPGQRFIELVIATTIGSIVGAYIARDIDFSFNLLARAVLAVALLSVFFFLVYRVSISWGQRKTRKRQETQEIPEEDYPQEYPPERAGEQYLEEEQEELPERKPPVEKHSARHD